METLRQIIIERSTPEPNTGCWLWDKPTEVAKGFFYGIMWVNKKNTYAHRVSYQAFIGEIKPGLVICHKCDTPACVNPDHLFAGTQKQNLEDASKKGRLDWKICLRGHEIVGKNKLIGRSNGSACRLCWNIRRQEYRARLRLKNPIIKRTHCKKGHELTVNNLYFRSDETLCKTCDLSRKKKYRDRIKLEREVSRV